MKKHKWTKALFLTLVVLTSLCTGAFAATNLKTISAQLNYSLGIKLDGEEQIMYDELGNRVYTISYNDTTYLPVRAISEMLGIGVEWDPENYDVLLDSTANTVDFIDTFDPTGPNLRWQNNLVFKSEDAQVININGKEYDHFIKLSSSDVLTYDLGGKYKTLTLHIYSDCSSKDLRANFYGDNGTLLSKTTIKSFASPYTITIDVSGVKELTISSNDADKTVGACWLYLFDAHIR